jgi:hypothetical protein
MNNNLFEIKCCEFKFKHDGLYMFGKGLNKVLRIKKKNNCALSFFMKSNDVIHHKQKINTDRTWKTKLEVNFFSLFFL